MKSTMIAKVEKRIMAVMLSLMMVVGVFAGMRLDTKAAETYTVGENLTEGGFVKEGDTIIIPKPANGYYSHYVNVYIFNPDPDGHAKINGSQLGVPSPATPREVTITMPSLNYDNKEYTNYRVTTCRYSQRDEAHYQWNIFFQAVDESEVVLTEVVSGNESQSDVSVAKTQSGVSVATSSHICSFQWVTTVDPQVGIDGLEKYKCVECGAVQESHPIPASVAAVKDFYGNIKEAPENGSITYDSGKLYTISDYLLKKMSERSDVAVTVNFEYQNAKYELTFLAGTDFTPVLTDEETMYGYFGVAAKLGLTVVAK